MSEELVRRMMETVQRTLEWRIERSIEKFGKLCESPIEILLLVTMDIEMSLSGSLDGRSWQGMSTQHEYEQHEYEPGANVLWTIVPQYKWRGYRIDFAFILRGDVEPGLFVECDGHDFHERTPEQAERDRTQDRDFQRARIPILRFTGREIYRDPAECVAQIEVFLIKLLQNRRDTHRSASKES